MDTRYMTTCACALLAPAWGASAQNAEKVEALAQRDPHGFIISITAASVVFVALFVLYVIYKYVGKAFSGKPFGRMAAGGKRKGAAAPDAETALAIAMALGREENSEVQAAIALALHAYGEDAVHDSESFVLTIRHASGVWNAKHLSFRQMPK